ncbi:MAG TPA: ribosome silencing factor [Rhizobiales bacterium]|nr:ribosomal silencing factor RsfS [bacterium BMS3Bbin10]HDO53020.1 ribosome silencing factor [Hyphomicrobiales bacterium]
MGTSREGAAKGAPVTEPARNESGSAPLLGLVLETLDEAKAMEVISIDLAGKSSIADYMVVASGRSNRHVGAIADQLVKRLKKETDFGARVEGLPHCDWVLIDAGDVIVHVFRPEVREFYNLEKMWLADRPDERVAV